MKNIVLGLVFFVTVLYGQAYHSDMKNTAMHTPFRWTWANSTARLGQATIKRDTTKLGYQKSDFSVWYLQDTLPTWIRVGTYKSDSLSIDGILIKGNDITGVDSSDHRIVTADSATIPVFKGVVTKRDSTYFAGGVRGVRLYMPQADIDSLVGDVKAGGNFFVSGNVGIGTATPDALLHIKSNDATKQMFLISNGTNNQVEMGSTGWNGYLTMRNGTGPVMCLLRTDGVSYLNGGNVGIGTETPDSLFTVNGSSNITGNSRVGGAVRAATGHFTSNVNITGGLQFDGGDLMTIYDVGTFACTLKTSDFTEQIIGTATYVRVGRALTVFFPVLSGTSSSTTFYIYCKIPFTCVSSASGTWQPVPLRDGGTYTIGKIAVYGNNNYARVYLPTEDAFTTSGTKGIDPITVPLITN